MALRTIREMGDPVLKEGKAIKEVTPASGLSRRILLGQCMRPGVSVGRSPGRDPEEDRCLDITEEQDEPLTMVRSRDHRTGRREQTGYEGSKGRRSDPPNRVVVRYNDLDMNEGQGRGIPRPCDSPRTRPLDGHLYAGEGQRRLCAMLPSFRRQRRPEGEDGGSGGRRIILRNKRRAMEVRV